ncbi:unnamed protein product [Closterium sp. Yama58-4]|nr:unnamed protein product [Closterium sp. Yama58-4]
MELVNHRGVTTVVDKKDLVSIADNKWLTDGVVDFHNVLLSIRWPRLKNGKTWAAIDCNAWANTTGFNAPVSAGGGLPLLEHDYLAVPVYLDQHYALVIVTSPIRMVDTRAKGDDAPFEMVLLDSSRNPKNVDNIFSGTKVVLSTLAHATHPHADKAHMAKMLEDVECHVLTVSVSIPYTKLTATLVDTNFDTLKSGFWFRGVSAFAYRRSMRSDLRGHAMGELLRKLEEEGLEIPSQQSGTTTNTKREVGVMNAGFTAISSVLGLTRDQLIAAGATLSQLGVVGEQSAKEHDNCRHAPATPGRPSGSAKPKHDSPDDDLKGSSTRVSLDSKFAATVGAFNTFPAQLPIPGTIPHWVLSRLHGGGVSTLHPSLQMYGLLQEGAAGPRAFDAPLKEEPVPGCEDGDEEEEGDSDSESKPTKYTGVYVEAGTGKFGVKILMKDEHGKKRQKRVGAYTTIEEVAIAYAAAAYVLRPKDSIRGHTVALSAADKAALKGCTGEILKVLVDGRMWWRWRVWREAYEVLKRKATKAKKTATPAKRGRKRKQTGEHGGATVTDGQCEKAGSEDTLLVGNESNEGKKTKKSPDFDVAIMSSCFPYLPFFPVSTSVDNTGGETSEASPGRALSQGLQTDSQDARPKDDDAGRNSRWMCVDDVGAGAAEPSTRVNDANDEEDDEDVGAAMRNMFDNNMYREDEPLDTNGEEVRVSASVFRSLLKSQDESAQKVARLETLLLNALAKANGGSHRRKAEKQRDPSQECMNPKRACRVEAVADDDDDDNVDDDDDYEDVANTRTRRRHLRSARSPVLQRALDLLPADKAWKRLCEHVRVQLFMKKPNASMTFYPSSDDKTYGVCSVLDCLPHSFACLALAADKTCRADLNKTLSEWKTRAASRVRDIALPKLGFFRDERDELKPLVLSNWSNDRDGMPFASGAFAACAKAAFNPKKAAMPLSLKVYHLAWLEHVVTDSIMFWERRMGRLSNSAGGNGHVVNGLKVLVKASVSSAIRHYNPDYDTEKEEWIWGRHGLRISACGLEDMKPNAGAVAEEGAGDDAQSVSVDAE